MPGFYPAPQPHYTGDLGTVFDYFSADGAKERQMGHQAKQQQLQWALDQAGLMHDSPDKYLGAQNPNDFEYVNKAFGNQTERQNADTRSGDLQFRKDWAPDESARGWAGLGVSQQNADSSRIGADASMLRSRTDADYAGDESALKWANQGVAQQNANTSANHYKAQDAFIGDDSSMKWAEIAQRGKTAEDNVMAHMIQFMPPEVAQTVAKMMAMKAVPGYDEAVKQQDAERAQRAQMLLGGSGHNGTGARDSAARGAEAQANAPHGRVSDPTNVNRAQPQGGGVGGAGGIPIQHLQTLSQPPPTPRQGPINDAAVYGRMKDFANPARVRSPQEMGYPTEQGFDDPFNGLIDQGPVQMQGQGQGQGPNQYANNIPTSRPPVTVNSPIVQSAGSGQQQQQQPRVRPQFVPGIGIVMMPEGR